MLGSISEIARLHGVTPQAIRKMFAKEGAPKRRKGRKYDLTQAAAFITRQRQCEDKAAAGYGLEIESKFPPEIPPGQPAPAAPADASTEKRQISAGELRYLKGLEIRQKMDEKARRLVPIDEVLAERQETAAILSAGLFGELPAAVAAAFKQVPYQQAKTKVTEIVRSMVNRWVESGRVERDAAKAAKAAR